MVLKKKKDKDEQIKNAAIEEFLKLGISNSSMENIAINASVSKRTLYKYYPSKEDIFDTLIDELLSDIREYITFYYCSKTPVESLFSNLIQQKLEFTLQPKYFRLARLIFNELISNNIDKEKLILKLKPKDKNNLIIWLDKFRKDGRIKDDVEDDDIIYFFHSTVEGHIFYPLLLKFKKDFSEEELKKIKCNISQAITKTFFKEEKS